MIEPAEQPDEISGSGRRTVEAVLRTFQNRAELFGLEIEEEGRWVVSALVWAAAAIFLGVLAVTVIVLTVVILVPESARPWVLVGFSALFLFLAISAFSGLKKHFTNRRPPLADTVSELKKDIDWIRSLE